MGNSFIKYKPQRNITKNCNGGGGGVVGGGRVTWSSAPPMTSKLVSATNFLRNSCCKRNCQNIIQNWIKQSLTTHKVYCCTLCLATTKPFPKDGHLIEVRLYMKYSSLPMIYIRSASEKMLPPPPPPPPPNCGWSITLCFRYKLLCQPQKPIIVFLTNLNVWQGTAVWQWSKYKHGGRLAFQKWIIAFLFWRMGKNG